MKYYIKQIIRGKYYNAGGKAVSDANRILETKGYKPLEVGYRTNIPFLKQIISIFDIIHLFLMNSKRDVVFLQYPLYVKYKKTIYYYLLKKASNIKILIHDINFLRSDTVLTENELLLLKKANKIIAHTPSMKNLFVEKGIKKDNIYILYLFDYLTSEKNKYPTKFNSIIIFAGNLNKSIFIKQLNELSEITFYLYGKDSPNINCLSNSVQYKGKFAPENIGEIEGDWGLVWDGDSIDTCSGSKGEYLRYNSSHKISLYIAAEKPVIIWEESSLRDYIINNKLGIAINSLSEIKNKIQNLSFKEKEEIKISLKQFSKKVKSGEMLMQLI